MKITELRRELETKIAEAISNSAFFEESPWMDTSAVLGNESISLAASAAAAVIVAVAEAQEYALAQGYVKEPA